MSSKPQVNAWWHNNSRHQVILTPHWNYTNVYPQNHYRPSRESHVNKIKTGGAIRTGFTEVLKKRRRRRRLQIIKFGPTFTFFEQLSDRPLRRGGSGKARYSRSESVCLCVCCGGVGSGFGPSLCVSLSMSVSLYLCWTGSRDRSWVCLCCLWESVSMRDCEWAMRELWGRYIYASACVVCVLSGRKGSLPPRTQPLTLSLRCREKEKKMWWKRWKKNVICQ